MDSPDTGQLLKVFSGPHAGAEVLLRDGEIVIGSDEACDVILNDRFVDPQHVRISLSAGQVRLVPADGATVLLAGQPIPVEGTALPPFAFFTLGTTHLAVGPCDSPWPRTSFPEFQLAAPSPAPASEPAPAVAASLPSPSKTAPALRRRRWLLVAGAVCLVSALLWLAGQFLGNQSADGLADTARGRDLGDELAAVLTAQQAAELVKLSERNGRYRAQGYLPTAEQRRTLERELKRVAPSIELRLWDDEALLAGVRRMLVLHQLELEAASGDPGEVIVRGKVAEAKSWDAVRKSIREDLRSLRKLTEHVEVDATLEDALNSTGSNSRGKSTARRAGSKSPVAGAEAIAAQPASLGPKWEELRAQVAGLQIGHTSSLVLGNGDRLFVGSALPGGFVVQSIETDAVICSNGIQRIKLPLRSDK